LKILLVNKFHYRRGGDCVYTLALADLLRSAGHQVFHFSMRHPMNFSCPEERYFVSHIDFADLNARKNPLNGLRVLWRSIYSWEARTHVRRLIQELKPDIAHLQNIHAHITPSILTEFEKAHIPVIWTLHDYKLICPEDSLLSHGRICEACRGQRFYHCALKRCKKGSLGASIVAALEAYAHQFLRIPHRVARFVSPSQFLKKKFVEFGWPEKKIVHVRNFLPDLAQRPVRYESAHGIYVGTLRTIKGVGTLLKALAQTPDIPFHILGDGPERKVLEEEAKRQRLRNVTFMGFLSGPDLQTEIDQAAFGVVPSQCYENCPYAAMELMAAGKPVIASRLGGLSELIDEGATGYLFQPESDGELAERMRTLWSSAGLRRQMGAAARARAENMFKPEAHLAAITELYADARMAKGSI
jgi:glycosyltransferase involved in cell wall biosynthesis